MSLGLVAAISGLPQIVFGIIAGPMADRYDRKTQIVIAQTFLVALNIAVGVLITTGRLEVWHIYVSAFLTGSVQAFQVPSRQALVNEIVGEGRLLNAISLNSAAMNVARSVGPAICGNILVFLSLFMRKLHSIFGPP
jgi:MFS family permease